MALRKRILLLKRLIEYLDFISAREVRRDRRTGDSAGTLTMKIER